MTPTPEPWDDRAAFAADREAVAALTGRHLDPFRPPLHPILLNIGDAWSRHDLAAVRYWGAELAAAAAALPAGTYSHAPPPRPAAGGADAPARVRPGVRLADRASDVVPAGVVRDIIRRKEAGEPLSTRERVLDGIDVRRNRDGADVDVTSAAPSPELVAELERYGCRVAPGRNFTLVNWTLPPQTAVQPPPDRLPQAPWEPGPGPT